MGLDDSLVQEIVRRLRAVTSPSRIILFGSAASGTMTAESDIDLLIVAPAPPRTLEARASLQRALRGLGYAFDIFVLDEASYESTKHTFGGLAYPAHNHGRTIYEAA